MSQMPDGHQGGNWRRNKIGTIVPMGSGGNEKEFIRLGSGELEKDLKGANILIRGSLTKEETAQVWLILTIAGDVPEIIEFVADLTASSLAEGGLARSQLLQAHTGIAVPSALPTSPFNVFRRNGRDGRQPPRQIEEGHE
jgi:hypothetical protein